MSVAARESAKSTARGRLGGSAVGKSRYRLPARSLVAVALLVGVVGAVQAYSFFLIPLVMGMSVTLLMTVGSMQEMWPSSTSGGDVAKVGQAVQKVRISGTLVSSGQVTTVDLPAKVSQALPAEPIAAVAAGSGTYANPLLATDASVRIVVYANSNFCKVEPTSSVDGNPHYLGAATYDSLAAVTTACVNHLSAYMSAPVAWCANYPGPNFTPDGATPKAVSYNGQTVYVQDVQFYDCHYNPRINASGSGIGYQLVEPADGVKRMKASATGFEPDTKDPDWTPQELSDATTRGPGAVVVNEEGQRLTEVSVGQNGIKLGQVAQAGANVRRVITIISPEGAVSSSSDTTEPGAVLAEGTSNIGGSGGTSGGSGSSQSGGGSCGGSGQPACAIDDSGFSGKDAGLGTQQTAANQAYTDRDNQLKATKDANPDWKFDWLPSVKPGPPMACRPLVMSASISHGPAAGLGSSHEVDICAQLGVLREYMAWLVSILTVYYLWGVLVGRSSEGKGR